MKKNFLNEEIKHIDIKEYNVVPMVDAMSDMAFQARNLSRGAKIFNMMQEDGECVVFLTLAGSLISAGLKMVIVDMIKNNMIDAIVSTGANIVDQDFFEALGFKHYKGSQFVDDQELRKLSIDRIYDTYIDEDDLRICDDTIKQIANKMLPGSYSSREFIVEMGKYLDNDEYMGNVIHEELERLERCKLDSIVYNCYKMEIPIFVPAFSDCSAGFGLVAHQYNKESTKIVTIDSVKDFREITEIKIKHPTSGIFMIGGGVPKNFVQDIVVAAEVLEYDVDMHKYAVQITVADERDGALSGSTLKEACSWGKVDTTHEQMVYCEATIAFPLIAGYAYHKGGHISRIGKKLNKLYCR